MGLSVRMESALAAAQTLDWPAPLPRAPLRRPGLPTPTTRACCEQLGEIDEAGDRSGDLPAYPALAGADDRRSRARHAADRVGYVGREADPAATCRVCRLQRGRRRITAIVQPDGSHLVEPSDDQLRARLDQPWPTERSPERPVDTGNRQADLS